MAYIFIDDVVREIAALTPGRYFHMGGDEVKTLTPAQYKAFVERVQTIVHKHGKQMIGWDEVAVASLGPTSIVQPAAILGVEAPNVQLTPNFQLPNPSLRLGHLGSNWELPLGS